MPIRYNEIFAAVGRYGLLLDRVDAANRAALPAWAVEASADPRLPTGLESGVAGLASAAGSFASGVARDAQEALVAAMDAQASLPSRTLQAALYALVAGMRRDGQTVRRSGVRLCWQPGSPSRPLAMQGAAIDASGNRSENCFPEAIGFAATSPTTLAGAAPRATATSPPGDAPGSSGYSGGLAVRDAASTAGDQLLQNGEFDTWSSNLPSSWRLLAGTAGTTVLRGTVNYSGTGTLQLAGDGTARPGVFQEFGVDTPRTLPPSANVALNLWAQLSSTPGRGSLVVELQGPSGFPLVGPWGPCSAEFDLASGLDAWGVQPWGRGAWGQATSGGEWGVTGWGMFPWGSSAGTPFTPLGGVFRTPAQVPAGCRLAIRLGQPLPAGHRVRVDRAVACVATTLYIGGPSVAVFSGTVAPAIGDAATLTVENDLAGRHQRLFERLFSMRQLGLCLPSSATPTILDPPPALADPAVRLLASA